MRLGDPEQGHQAALVRMERMMRRTKRLGLDQGDPLHHRAAPG
jgi:hypothetical protein